MDSMEINKALAATLVAGIAFFVTGLIGDELVRVKPLKQSPLKIATAPAENASAPAQGPAALPALAPLLAKADVGAGEAIAKKVCSACHVFVAGAAAGIGPNLYNVVGRERASMPGYNYSNALKEKKGDWSWEELNHWLYKPSAYAPGTRMGYAGLSSAQDRANIIDYLHTLSPSPLPLPDPGAAEAAAKPDVTAPVATANAPGATPVAGSAPTKPDAAPSLNVLLASADAKKGQADTMKYACVACHSFNEGGKAGIGPNLYNVVNGPHAHMAGYDYSVALKAKQGPWTYAELDKWLEKPSAYAPGTKMGLAGVPDPKQRAEIIAYLRSLSADPAPLPTP